MRHIEVIVEKWPIGSRQDMMRKGERVMIDDFAAHILVETGKAVYVEDEQPRQKRKYNRRDMRAAD